MWEDDLENEEYERLIYDYDFSEFGTGGYERVHSSKRDHSMNRYQNDEDDMTASDSNED